MNKDCAFTICAKNYLAQALTLRESFLFYNKDKDFHIFLSDNPEGLDPKYDVIPVDETIVPDNTTLYFKYDVVEYATAVKPFIIIQLFNKGYNKVSYIDPDIFVTDSFNSIYDALEEKSAILTPHRCTVLNEGELTPEISILRNGMFNLGFLAVKNDSIGQELIKWWSEKLSTHCYMDVRESLAVDQKWMEFAMCFYPEQIHVSSHLGMNVAIWNLQERELLSKNGKFFVRSKKNSDDVFPLLFWHFSSFNPKIKQLSKNNPDTSFERMPVIKDLATLYIEKVLNNDFDSLSKLKYAYNFYDNGLPVLPIHRRLYRINEEKLKNKCNPFDSNGSFYSLLKKNHLLVSEPQSQGDPRRITVDSNINNVKNKISKGMWLIFRILGIQRYTKLLKAFSYYSKYENNDFLLKW